MWYKYCLICVMAFLLMISGAVACSEAEQEPEIPEQGESEEENREPELTEEEKMAQLKEEREILEEQRKEDLGEFYVPLPAIGEEKERVTVEAKGLYVTSNTAGRSFDEENVEYYAQYIKDKSGQTGNSPDASRLSEINKLEEILGICLATEINTLVIDVKNDDGLVTWESDIDFVNEVDSNWTTVINDYERLMDYLKENDIYTIARIVVFRDPYLARARNEYAIQMKDREDEIFIDRSGVPWVNPFDKDVWRYNVAVAREAALRGFDEIQWDYVRFPENARTYDDITYFPNRNDRPKDKAIEEFLIYAREEMEPYNVHVAADVFGVITRSWDDGPEQIGQTWRRMARHTDYMCPMIYPSHYGENWYGFRYPDAEPYGVVKAALQEAIERNAALEDPALIRPWIQGFTASWVPGNIKYTPEVIAEQIIAARELGINEYLVWSAGNNYQPMTFFYEDRVGEIGPEPGKDLTGRTPEEALQRFLSAQQHGRYPHIFLLTPLEHRESNYDKLRERLEEKDFRLARYTVNEIEKETEDRYVALVDYRYESKEGTAEDQKGEYRIVRENQVFKVIKPELEFRQEEETAEE